MYIYAEWCRIENTMSLPRGWGGVNKFSKGMNYFCHRVEFCRMLPCHIHLVIVYFKTLISSCSSPTAYVN